MSRKVLTRECPSCEYCSVDDNVNFICSWGKSKRTKVMDTPKRKAVVHCNLSKKGK